MHNSEDLLLAYVERTLPVQWVGWCMDLPDGHTRELLSTILFDECDVLRYLPEANIRRQVIDLVLQDTLLGEIVRKELASAMTNSGPEIQEAEIESGTASDSWKLVSTDQMTLEEYPCGVRAGDILRLRRDLKILDHKGQETGTVHPAGEVFFVLFGNPLEPNVIWLERGTGEKHTWDESVLETFEPTGKRDKR